jgi:iron complex outermembrane receptor protein
MKKIILILFLSVLALAGNEDFLKTLNEVSEIATESKLNIDKTPSNVDVINREFIVKSGAKTLLDLLKYLPSVEIAMTPSGKKQLIVRGSRSAFRDKIKLMINGVEVTNDLYNNQFYYYNFPASLIKRIEFTKTPDAVLYGENAFLGVLNIVTLDNLSDNQVSAYLDNDGYQVSFFQKNGALLSDGYYSYSYPSLYSPTVYKIDLQDKKAVPFRDHVKINALEKNLGAGIRYTKNNSKILFRINYYKKGNFYGIENIPPLKRDRGVNFYHAYLEYRYSKYLRYNLKEEFRIGAKNYKWDGSYRFFPYDLNPASPDIIAGAKISEYQLYLKNTLNYEGEKNNVILVLDMRYAKPYDYCYYQYIDGVTPKFYTKNLFQKNIKRKSVGIGAEDLLTLKDNFSMIFGYRIDNYNSFGSKRSYKGGFVYNINDSTTFKILYNNAFRVPSWIELYAATIGAFNGNPDLKPETISMWEYILLKSFDNDKLKLTFYRGKNKNFIGRSVNTQTGKLIYKNLGDYDIKGYEISYKKFMKKFEYYLSYSYNNNVSKLKENSEFVHDFKGYRKRWYKGWGRYCLAHHTSLFVSFMYGSKIKMPNPYVNDIGNYFALNSNISYKKDDLRITVGVDNITDHKNYIAVFPSDLIYNRYYFIYKNAEIPYEGRKFYIKVVKRW